MGFAPYSALVFSIFALSACSSGSGVIDGTGGGGGSGGSGTASFSAGRVTGASVDPNGWPTKGTVKLDGTDTYLVSAYSDQSDFSDGYNIYRYQPGTDGQSFSLIGYDLSGNYVGEYIFAASAAPTSGSASYVGDYHGEAFGPYGEVFISGAATLTADFSSGSFSGVISNRSFFAVSGYDNAELASNIEFSGSVASNGVMQGFHVDGNSYGSVNAIASSSGAVGTVNVDHIGASLYSPGDITEYGTFAGSR